MERYFDIYLNAGNSVPVVINANQYDASETWIFTLYTDDNQQYTPQNGSIVGLKSDGKTIANAGTVNGDGQVVIAETEQMTACAGINIFELILNGNHGTANFVVLVEPRPGDNATPSDSDLSLMQEAIEAASTVGTVGTLADKVTNLESQMEVWLTEHAGMSNETILWEGRLTGTGSVELSEDASQFDTIAVYTQATSYFEAGTASEAHYYKASDLIANHAVVSVAVASTVSSTAIQSAIITGVVGISGTQNKTFNLIDRKGLYWTGTATDDAGIILGSSDSALITKVVGIRNEQTDAEVVAARVGSDGTQYNNLKARLDAENSDLKSAIEQSGGGGQPVPVTLASAMSDTDKIYLYLGSESGYEYGYIYAYTNDAWTKTRLYGQGQKGTDGTDGYSPSVSVASTSTGVTITATDKNGTTTASVSNGTATQAQVDAWLDAHPEATTTVADGSVSQKKLASDVASEAAYGDSSDNADIILNPYLTYTNYKVWNVTTGASANTTIGNRSEAFNVKGGSIILLEAYIGIVFWDESGEFISGFSQTGDADQTITVPSNAKTAGVFCTTSRGLKTNSSTGYRVYTNFRVTGFAFKSETLHVNSENVDGVDLPTMDANVASLLPVKSTVENLSIFDIAGIKAQVVAQESANVDIYMTKSPSLYHADETYDPATGEIIEAVGGSRFDLMYTKPGASLLITKYITICFFTYAEKFISSYTLSTGAGSATETLTVPDNCYKVGICDAIAYIPTEGSPSVYCYVKTNCYVTDITGSFDSVALYASDLKGIGDVSSLPTDINRYLEYKAIKTQNQMRHAFRIASFNIKGTGGNGQTNWSAIKSLLQKYGVDIVCMQEVFKPMGEDNTKVLSVEMASWHLKRFTELSSFPSNERVVATTDEFTLVSASETLYATQGGYGNRYYLKSEWELPRWKGKKSSEHLKMSVYSTQLETTTATAKTQARELLTAMQADPNPFIVLTGDFNDFTTDQSIWGIFTEAGYKAALTDTSTPTAGRGFYDNVFVNERIEIVENDVLPTSDLLTYYTTAWVPISDHDAVLTDIILDYSNIIAVKTSLPNCTLSGGENWLDRRQTEPVVYTVTADEGYTISSIATGQGDNDITYSNGAVVKNGNTVTITPSLVVGDVWINVTTTADS